MFPTGYVLFVSSKSESHTHIHTHTHTHTHTLAPITPYTHTTLYVMHAHSCAYIVHTLKWTSNTYVHTHACSPRTECAFVHMHACVSVCIVCELLYHCTCTLIISLLVKGVVGTESSLFQWPLYNTPDPVTFCLFHKPAMEALYYLC